MMRLAQAMRSKDEEKLEALGLSKEELKLLARQVPVRRDGPTPPGEVPDEMRSTVERFRRVEYD